VFAGIQLGREAIGLVVCALLGIILQQISINYNIYILHYDAAPLPSQNHNSIPFW